MSRRRWLWFAIAAFVLARLAVVASIADVFGYGEEFTKGAVAKGMLDGLPLAHHRLSYGYHEGGGFAVAHLKALLFLVMGPSVLANKVAALLLGVALLAVVVFFAREHLGRGEDVRGEERDDVRSKVHSDVRDDMRAEGRTDVRGADMRGDEASFAGTRRNEDDRDGTRNRAAWIAATLFVLAPLNFVRFSLLNLGTHFEALIFTLLVLHFTLRLTRAKTGRTRDAVGLGLAAGFGLFFSLTILPALGASAVWIAVRRRGRVFGRETWLAAAGFAIGALPLWIKLALVGKQGIVVGAHEATTGWNAFVDSLTGIPGPILRSGDPWTIAYAVLMVVAIVAGVVLCARRAHALSSMTLALYTFAYAASGFALEYHPNTPSAFFFLLRLVPFWMFGTLFAAHGVSMLWDKGGLPARTIATVTFGVAVANGVRDGVAMCEAGRPSTPITNLAILARTKGYTFSEYFDKSHEHVDDDREQFVRVYGAFHEDPRRLLPALTMSVFDHWKDTPEAAVEYARTHFGANATYAWRGLGRVMHPNWINDVPGAFAKLETLPEDARESVAEGLGRTPLFPYFLVKRLNEAVAQEVPERWHDAWLRGVGWRAYYTYPYRPDLSDAFVESRPESERAALRAGLEEAREIETIH